MTILLLRSVEDYLRCRRTRHGGLNKWMDAAAEIGRNPLSKRQIHPERRDEQADAGRDYRTHLARPKSHAQTGTDKYSFSLFS